MFSCGSCRQKEAHVLMYVFSCGSCRQKEAHVLMELYSSAATTGAIDGPRSVWKALLVGPFVAFWLVMLLAHQTSVTGWVALFGVVVIVTMIKRHTHRMHHVCRWPNPIYAGMFGAGIVSTMLCYVCAMFTGILNCCVTPVYASSLCVRSPGLP